MFVYILSLLNKWYKKYLKICDCEDVSIKSFFTLTFELGRQHLYGPTFPGVITFISASPCASLSLLLCQSHNHFFLSMFWLHSRLIRWSFSNLINIFIMLIDMLSSCCLAGWFLSSISLCRYRFLSYSPTRANQRCCGMQQCSLRGRCLLLSQAYACYWTL